MNHKRVYRVYRAQGLAVRRKSESGWRVPTRRTADTDLATKALGYALNQEVELLRVLGCLRTPTCHSTTPRSERALRKVVVGAQGMDVRKPLTGRRSGIGEISCMLGAWTRERVLKSRHRDGSGGGGHGRCGQGQGGQGVP